MKKKGFTLAEALIALGIVAIVAMLALPMFNKTKPDPIKVSYIRTYDSIVTAVSGLINNKALYPMQNDTNVFETLTMKGTLYNYPLLNTQEVKDAVSGANLSGGDIKFCEALAFTFGAASKSCLPGYVSEYEDSKFIPSFRTKDGVEIMVRTKLEYKPTDGIYDNALFESAIYFDVDGPKGNNCIYNSKSCTSPDRFKVFVLADGTVKAADPAGKAHLKTRTIFKKLALKPVGSSIDTTTGPDAILDPNSWCGVTEGVRNGQICTPCSEGQTLVNGKCESCEGKIVDGKCKPCSDYQQVWKGDKCVSCSSGQTLVDGKCKSCEGKIGNGTCMPCSNYEQVWNGSSCVSCANYEQIWNGSTCQSCKDTENYSVATGTCISCTSREAFNSATGLCECDSRFPNRVDGKCIACDPELKPLIANGVPVCNGHNWFVHCNEGYWYQLTEDSGVPQCVPVDKALREEQVNGCPGQRPITYIKNGEWACSADQWVIRCNPGYHKMGDECVGL